MFKLLVILTYAALYPFIALLMTWPDRPGVRQVSEGSEEQRKMEETGCEIICGAPTTLAVKGLMMMMMMMMMTMTILQGHRGIRKIKLQVVFDEKIFHKK